MVEPSPDASLDGLIYSIATRDLRSTLGALSTVHAPSVVGSEAGEVAQGREAVEAFFTRIYARPGTFQFELPQRSWTRDHHVAWLVADGSVVEPGRTDPKSYRLTAVFVREDDDWRLALWSGSEPM